MCRKVLLYLDPGHFPLYPYTNDFVYSLLFNPLIYGEVDLEVHTQYPRERGDYFLLSLEEQRLREYDLLVIPHGKKLRLHEHHLISLTNYLKTGGSALIVQPMDTQGNIPKEFERVLGCSYREKVSPVPYYSTSVRHKFTRILGLSSGEIAYPHIRSLEQTQKPVMTQNYVTRSFLDYDKEIFYQRFDPLEAEVLTSIGDDPDLMISKNYKLATFTTDAFHDLIGYVFHPKFQDYAHNLALITINVIRHLLGIEVLNQPLPVSRYRLYKYSGSYGVSRRMLYQLQRLMGKKVDVRPADACFKKACLHALKGEDAESKRNLSASVERLREALSDLVDCDTYILDGCHGGFIFDDEQVCSEFDWPDFTISWLKNLLYWIEYSNGRLSLEVAANTWGNLVPYDTEIIDHIRDLVGKGLVEIVNGTYSEPYAIFCSESVIKQFQMGLKTIKEIFRTDVDTYACQEAFLTPQFPQILRGFGFKYAVLRARFQADIKGVKNVLKIFWEAPDGTSIEALPSYPDLRAWDPSWGFLYNEIPDLLFDGKKRGYKRIVFSNLEDLTTPTFRREEMQAVNSLVPLFGKMATPKEFFQKTDPPTKTLNFKYDDIHHTLPWGMFNDRYRLDRLATITLLSSEILSAFASLLGRESEREELQEEWEALLSCQGHDVYVVPFDHPGRYLYHRLPNYPGPLKSKTLKEWAHAAYSSCIKESREMLEESLSFVAEKVNTLLDAPKEAIKAIVIFNPLSWKRSGMVSLEIELKPGEAGSLKICDAEGEVPFQKHVRERYSDGSIRNAEIQFLATVPSYGYRTYYLSNEAPRTKFSGVQVTEQSDAIWLENEYHRLKIYRGNGTVESIYDKELNREFLSLSGNLFIVKTPMGYNSMNKEAEVEVLERGPTFASVRVKGSIIEYPYQLEIRLCQNIKRIDFSLKIKFPEEGVAIGFGEVSNRLRAVFPVNVSEGEFFVDAPFGVHPTTKKAQFSLSFVDYTDDSVGLALMHRGVAGNLLSDNEVSLILAYGKRRPSPIGGTLSYEYSIYTHAGNWLKGRVKEKAQELNFKLVPTITGLHSEVLPKELSFMEIEGDNVAVSSVYEDKGSLAIRLYELEGKGKEIFIKTPFDLLEANVKRLDGKTTQKLPVGDKSLSFSIKPFEIKTLSLKISP